MSFDVYISVLKITACKGANYWFHFEINFLYAHKLGELLTTFLSLMFRPRGRWARARVAACSGAAAAWAWQARLVLYWMGSLSEFPSHIFLDFWLKWAFFFLLYWMGSLLEFPSHIFFGFLAQKSIFWYNIGQFNSRLHSSVVVTLVLDAQEVDIWMDSVFQEISSPHPFRRGVPPFSLLHEAVFSFLLKTFWLHFSEVNLFSGAGWHDVYPLSCQVNALVTSNIDEKGERTEVTWFKALFFLTKPLLRHDHRAFIILILSWIC